MPERPESQKTPATSRKPVCARHAGQTFTRIQAMPPDTDVHRCAVIHVRYVVNLIDALGLKPFVDLFLHLNLAALKYCHLHR